MTHPYTDKTRIDNQVIECFKEYCIQQHDIECNQKYGSSFMKNIPYSFHLKCVDTQVVRFQNEHGIFRDFSDYNLARIGAWGHDLIEDARVTYNDIKNNWGVKIADIIYCCTEEKGKDRLERHSNKFFEELSQNEIATFVKLCDITANVEFSILTNSTMKNKYKKEYENIKRHLYKPEYYPVFTNLEKILF